MTFSSGVRQSPTKYSNWLPPRVLIYVVCIVPNFYCFYLCMNIYKNICISILVPFWWLTQPEDSATRASTHLCSLPFHLYYDFSIFHLLRQSVLQGRGKKIMKCGHHKWKWRNFLKIARTQNETSFSSQFTKKSLQFHLWWKWFICDDRSSQMKIKGFPL